MSGCQRCGKSVFFLRVNSQGYCSDCEKQLAQAKKTEKYLYRNDPAYRAASDSLKQQDRLPDKALKAQAKYKETGDASAATAVYGEIMIRSDPPLLRAESHTAFLVGLCMKAGRNNKAWSFLNSLIGTDRSAMEKIREYQAKILRLENKHDEAIKMFMLKHLARAHRTDTFDSAALIKEVSPSAKKLRRPPDTSNAIVDIAARHVRSRKYEEGSVIKQYQVLISAIRP